MHIEIISRRITLTRSRADSIRARLADTLRRFAGRVAQVRMELTDGNGRRGGGDKRCRIQVTPLEGKPIKLVDVRPTMDNAITRALSKLESTMHRQYRGATAA